jgi:predicted Zn finger-like uncharacterized protein
MKIVCDACSAKYSIADDKVKGKVFKIRCKKCSNIIVVRGSAGATEEPAQAQYDQKETRVYDYQGYDAAAPGGDESVWHVVIDQEQVGPMTMAEVQQRFNAGQIDADTYVWREGFADWQPLSAVDVFAGFAGGGAAAAGGGGAAAVASMFGGAGVDDGATTRADSGDLFAAASAKAAAQIDEDDGGGDLFGSHRGAPAAAARAPAAADAAAQSRLRGERNENSVLFSLGNLAQLASDAPRAAAAPAAAASHGGHGAATGAAGGEGSGLIDIRSMASAYLGDKGGAKPATGGIGSIDDLPVFASTAFNEPAVLMPTPGSRSNNNKLLYGLIALVGVLAIVAVVMVIKVLNSDDGKKDQQVAVGDGDKTDPDTAPGKGSAAADPAADPTKTAGTTPTPTGDGSGSAAAPQGTVPTAGSAAVPPPPDTATSVGSKPESTTAKPDKSDTKGRDDRTSSKPDRTSSKPDRTSSKPDSSSKPDTTSSKPESGGSCDEVSCVLNNYEGSCCAKFRKGKKPEATTTKSSSDLPESLDRGAVQAGVNQVKARVQACGSKSSAKGEVKVSVKVSPDGKVTGTTVKNTPDAALGSCVAAAMQKATFAKTQKGGSFAYPWKF